MNKKIFLSMISSVFIALLVVGTALAITIQIDGIKEAAWSGIGSQIPGSSPEDPNETMVPDGFDIRQFMWTNDQDYMYFLFETWGNIDMSSGSFIEMCVNIDRRLTGQTSANCGGMTGVDRTFVFQSDGLYIYEGAKEAAETPLTQIGANQLATDTVYLEAKIDFGDMAILQEGCDTPFPTAIYFDGATDSPDDHMPDSGLIKITCAGTTSVTLSNVDIRSRETSHYALAAGSVLLISAYLFTWVTRKQRV